MTTLIHAASPVHYNVTLNKGQIYRLPAMFSEVKVVAGCAWITYTGEDIFLRQGQSASFDHSKGPCIVSTANKEPLILELPA